MKYILLIALLAGGVLAYYAIQKPPIIYETPGPRTEADASAISMAIRSFMIENNRLPSHLSELTNDIDGKGAYMTRGIPKDPWGHEYLMTVTAGRSFQIQSAGPDGKFNTSDDQKWPAEGDP